MTAPRPPAGQPRLLTPVEARKTLGIGEDKLKRLADSGEIRFIWTPGHTRRYCAEDVEAVVRARESAG